MSILTAFLTIFWNTDEPVILSERWSSSQILRDGCPNSGREAVTKHNNFSFPSRVLRMLQDISGTLGVLTFLNQKKYKTLGLR